MTVLVALFVPLSPLPCSIIIKIRYINVGGVERSLKFHLCVAVIRLFPMLGQLQDCLITHKKERKTRRQIKSKPKYHMESSCQPMRCNLTD